MVVGLTISSSYHCGSSKTVSQAHLNKEQISSMRQVLSHLCTIQKETFSSILFVLTSSNTGLATTVYDSK